MNFDLRSILEPQQSSSANRIEQAFVGAHSDVGGGYATGDLSDVALMWMLNQAKQQGVKIDEQIVKDSGWNVVTLPILHDSSTNARQVPRLAPLYDARHIVYIGGKAVEVLDNTRIGGYSIADTKAVIRYYNRACGLPGSPTVGLVDMAKYSEWTKKFGVAIAFQQPTQTRICQ